MTETNNRITILMKEIEDKFTELHQLLTAKTPTPAFSYKSDSAPCPENLKPAKTGVCAKCGFKIDPKYKLCWKCFKDSKGNQ